MTNGTVNLRTKKEYTTLKDTITKLAGEREIIYAPSPGNWGDALINFGTAQFFEHHSIIVTEMLREDILSLGSYDPKRALNSILIVGGGGGWCDNWPTTRTFVREVSPLFHQVIVLPTTFNLPLLDDKSNIFYFSRDQSMMLRKDEKLDFCHDMAFFISIDAAEQKPELWRLMAFRSDKESSNLSFSFPSQIDISLLGNSFSSVEPFFEIINRFRVIYTDRLHVAIASALLGKTCRLLPGNYRKSELVWESSISETYPNVHLTEWNQLKKIMDR